MLPLLLLSAFWAAALAVPLANDREDKLSQYGGKVRKEERLKSPEAEVRNRPKRDRAEDINHLMSHGRANGSRTAHG